MSAALDRLRELLSPQAVLDAYRETGLRPAAGEWAYESDEGTPCACPATAVACHRGLSWREVAVACAGCEADAGCHAGALVAARLGLPEGLLLDFAIGLDGGNKVHGKCDRETWELGRTLRLALEDAGLVLAGG